MSETKGETQLRTTKPLSPRKFFERLYGHLESVPSAKESSVPPAKSELNSPLLFDDR